MFSKFIDDKREFESSQITEFNETYDVNASNFNVKYGKERCQQSSSVIFMLAS